MEQPEGNRIDKPREIARHCPNCGDLCWDSELNHHSSIKTAWGGSTLYGVCAKCANIHSKQEVKH